MIETLNLNSRSFADVCLASRTYALQHRSSSPYGVKFVPRCREDGTYAPVQCLESVGCWCVNGQGKPLPNTTVQHGKPVCVKKGKSNQRRSSPRNPVRNKRSECIVVVVINIADNEPG